MGQVKFDLPPIRSTQEMLRVFSTLVAYVNALEDRIAALEGPAPKIEHADPTAIADGLALQAATAAAAASAQNRTPRKKKAS